MTTPKKDIAGDARASAIAVQRHLMRLGERMEMFEHHADRLFEQGLEVVGLSVRCPGDESAEYLVIARGRDSTGKVVAFHGGETFAEAVGGFMSRMANDSLKWRKDEYA